MIFTHSACEPAHNYDWGSWLNTVETAGIRHHALKVRPHRKRAAAASSDLCPRREGVRTVLRVSKIASSPSNRRRADAADQSTSRGAADICVLETDLPSGQFGMEEEVSENLIHTKIFEETILVLLKF